MTGKREPSYPIPVTRDQRRGGERKKERIVQGWLPRLELDAQGHRELIKACAPHAACVFRFEGTLHKLVASPELATALSFSDVRIVRARAEAAGESWGRSLPIASQAKGKERKSAYARRQ